MAALTLIDGKLRTVAGALTLSADAENPCCCKCRPDALKNATVVFTTIGVADGGAHACNCAIFDAYINNKLFNQINHNNLNTGATKISTFNGVDLSDGSTTQGLCCVVYTRLECAIKVDSNEFIDGNCQFFLLNFGVSCHTSITDATITLANGTVKNFGILPNAQNTSVQICPDEQAFTERPRSPRRKRCKTSTETLATCNGCPCCAAQKVQCQRIAQNVYSGVGSALDALVSKFIFNGSKIMHTPAMQKYIATADIVPIEMWEQNIPMLVEVLRVKAAEFALEFDARRANILARRAVSIARAAV